MTIKLTNTKLSTDWFPGHEISIQVVERLGGPQYTITIPRPIAQAMGFKKGDVLEIRIHNGSIWLRKKSQAGGRT